MQANNYHGYILIYREGEQGRDPELSNVVGKPRGEWQTLEPMVIYPTITALVNAVENFDKKTHIVGEVIVHLLSERAEIISYGA